MVIIGRADEYEAARSCNRASGVLRLPVFCLAAGNSSVMPSGTFHAKSPVAAFMAMSSPNGGFWQGQLSSSLTRPFASRTVWRKRVLPFPKWLPAR